MKRTPFFVATFLTAALALFVACRERSDVIDTTAPGATTPITDGPALRSETVLTGYEIIWGMDFLPNGDLLFVEKRGKMYRRSGGNVTELTGLPTDINAGGQGGLFEVRVHPNYAQNGWVYATYAGSPSDSKAAQLNLIRFKIDGNRLTNVENLFKTEPTNTWLGHYGGRIEFARDGNLFLSVGEGGQRSYGGADSPNQNSQTLSNGWGKIHRLTDAGRVPADNPTLPGQSGPTSIYSYGHRNPQGLAIHPTTGELWETEHGPRGGDEVNVVKPGRNYGWPLVSYGINYDGKPVSASPTREGFENPVHTWTPSIGACGLTFVTGDKFKDWNGDLLAGALARTHLAHLDVNGNRVEGVEKHLDGQGRVRAVRMGRDGAIYVALEGPGRILRLLPQ